MDSGDQTLGHVPAWTNELAARSTHVDVITMFTGEFEAEANVRVRSLSKESGASEPRRLVEFYRSLTEILRERRIDACFAHMAPLFAGLAAPVLRVRGIPLLLWYAHTSVNPTLRVAHAVSDRVVTSTPVAFGVRSNKAFPIGQGVDTRRFRPPTGTGPDYERTVLSIGRLTRIKGIAETIEAVGVLARAGDRSVRLDLVGGTLTPADREYAEELRQLVDSLGIADRVCFHGGVPYREVAPWYGRGGLFLNMSGGAVDKATLESMASGCIPISRNAAFAELARMEGFDALVPGPGAAGFAEAIRQVMNMPEQERRELRSRLRAFVERDHSLPQLADRLIAHLEDLAATRRGPASAPATAG